MPHSSRNNSKQFFFDGSFVNSAFVHSDPLSDCTSRRGNGQQRIRFFRKSSELEVLCSSYISSKLKERYHVHSDTGQTRASRIFAYRRKQKPHSEQGRKNILSARGRSGSFPTGICTKTTALSPRGRRPTTTGISPCTAAPVTTRGRRSCRPCLVLSGEAFPDENAAAIREGMWKMAATCCRRRVFCTFYRITVLNRQNISAELAPFSPKSHIDKRVRVCYNILIIFPNINTENVRGFTF